MMTFSVRKHPKLKFYTSLIALIILNLVSLGALAIFLIKVSFDTNNYVIGLIFFLIFPLIFLFCFIFFLITKKNLFIKFTIQNQGIIVFHPQKGEMQFKWDELKELGVFEIVNISSDLPSFYKYICLSKKELTEKDKKYLVTKVTPQILCVDYRDEIIFEIQKYYSLPIKTDRITRWS